VCNKRCLDGNVVDISPADQKTVEMMARHISHFIKQV
jgi:hypothetical protein